MGMIDLKRTHQRFQQQDRMNKEESNKIAETVDATKYEKRHSYQTI